MNYVYLFIPIISVYVSGMYYPVDDKSGKKVWFRPPGWVFGVVWPILLSLLGYSWFLRPPTSAVLRVSHRSAIDLEHIIQLQQGIRAHKHSNRR